MNSLLHLRHSFLGLEDNATEEPLSSAASTPMTSAPFLTSSPSLLGEEDGPPTLPGAEDGPSLFRGSTVINGRGVVFMGFLWACHRKKLAYSNSR